MVSVWFRNVNRKTYQIVVVLVVDKVLFGEKAAELGVAQSIGLIRAELEHLDGICGSEVESTRDLSIESGESSVESIVGKLGGQSATDATTSGNVGVRADLVRGTGVVYSGVFHENLDVDLVQVLGHTEETGSKVFSSLDHTVLRLSTEDGQSILLGEVVEKLTVQLTVLNTELEVLTATKGSKKLSTELVGPIGQECQVSCDIEASDSGIVHLLRKSGRTSTTGRVTGTVTV